MYVYDVTRKNVEVFVNDDLEQERKPGLTYCNRNVFGSHCDSGAQGYGGESDAKNNAPKEVAVNEPDTYSDNYGETAPTLGTKDYAAMPEAGENDFIVSKTVSDTTQHFDHNPLNP